MGFVLIFELLVKQKKFFSRKYCVVEEKLRYIEEEEDIKKEKQKENKRGKAAFFM